METKTITNTSIHHTLLSQPCIHKLAFSLVTPHPLQFIFKYTNL